MPQPPHPAATQAATDTPRAAWLMLALAVGAQVVGTFFASAPAYLIPQLHASEGMSLAAAGALAAAPTIGKVVTLVAWGAMADRIGERWVIVAGLTLTALFSLAAGLVSGHAWLAVLLILGGAASASTDVGSGRVIVGWFPRRRRGLAMGIRQMAQPVGVALAALVVPTLASRWSIQLPLLVAGVLALLLALACGLGLRDAPTRAAEPATDAAGAAAAGVPVPSPAAMVTNPYRRSRFLARIHAVSALLVIPQFTLTTFALVWLTADQGWQATTAGIVVAVSQFTGAAGRIVIGAVSDRGGTRVRVMRLVALTGIGSMLLLGLASASHWAPAAAVMLVIAATISVADNGLAYTSVAEAAGPSWAGKALGLQNTGQYLVASAVGPAVGALIGLVGYPIAFALVGAAPLASLGLVPDRDEHWDAPEGQVR